jgi:hypothetical protein
LTGTDGKADTAMTQCANQAMAASRGDGIQVLPAPGELDLATAGRLAARGCAAVAHTRLLLLDLSGLSFATPVGSAHSSRSPTMPTGQGAGTGWSRRSRGWRGCCRSAAWTSGCQCLRPSMMPWRI